MILVIWCELKSQSEMTKGFYIYFRISPYANDQLNVCT